MNKLEPNLDKYSFTPFYMIRRLENSNSRSIDEHITVDALFDGRDFNFDLVVANLDGKHPTIVNSESDRAYFILEGQGEVRVGEEEYEVKDEDLILINAVKKHSIQGTLRYLIITSPPFDADNEQIIEE